MRKCTVRTGPARLVMAVLGLVMVMGLAAQDRVDASGEVNVYSYRQPFLVDPLFEAFTKETGIKVNVVFAKKGLVERMAAEGDNSPADVLLTVDIGRLTSAVKKGVSQAVTSATLSANIPEAYRDPAGHWFGLTRRARVVYASKERVPQTSITYEELADPKWKGKICIRSGQHVYNIALIASMIAHHGEEKTKTWLQGVKANLAGKPSGNDRAQVKRVYAGECDLAIGNTYYMAKMALNEKEPEQKEWAASVNMLFPNAGDRGTHVNLSGVVMARKAPNKDNALKLMEFLSSAKAQGIYASTNHEYPVADGIALSEMVKSWGELKADPIALSRIAELRARASELVDEVLFNDGPTS